MREMIDRMFNWKRYPSAVFWLVIPLAFLGWGMLFLRAFIEWKYKNDTGYFGILAFGTLLFIGAIWPIRKQLFVAIKAKEDKDVPG